ncbi:MAG TPA: sigma 54-interacting transcriptional regulator, partial [Rhodothermales bacterium]
CRQARRVFPFSSKEVLDEIEALALGHQAKLLRAIEAREFRQLGSDRAVQADFRLIAVSNRSLADLVARDLFRADLYYRLCVLHARVPPLRERRKDVPALCRHFIAAYDRRNGTRFRDFSRRGYDLLVHHDWPGNVRELENLVERICVNSTADTIDEGALAEWMIVSGSPDHERQRILASLMRNRWSREETARDLGISRSTLWRKISRYRLDTPSAILQAV